MNIAKIGDKVKGLWGDPAIRRDKLRDESIKPLIRERKLCPDVYRDEKNLRPLREIKCKNQAHPANP